MKKFQRFKWIPMIVKAYSDARLQQEIRLHQQTETPSFATERTEKKIAKTGQPKPAQNTTPKRHRSYAAKVGHRTQSQGRNGPGRTARNLNHYSQQSYRSMLHELRETKEKLNRLESIHTQLTEMQKNLDDKLVNLFDRLESSSGSERQSAAREDKSTNQTEKLNQASQITHHQTDNKPYND